MSEVKGENVTVTVRIRPMNYDEAFQNHLDVWSAIPPRGVQLDQSYAEKVKKQSNLYQFDNIFQGDNNLEVYHTCVANLVNSAMEGLNVTVFAYGITSSGKTYTMSGKTLRLQFNSQGTEDNPGIIPHTIEDVFRYIGQSERREFLLRVSYMEIYNETIQDLLNAETSDLRFMEDKKGCIRKPSEGRNRNVSKAGHEDYTERRSRESSSSPVRSKSRTGSLPNMISSIPVGKSKSGTVKISYLNLIDLAGSEKASNNSERRKEGAFINKSLLTLGTVISKLTEEKNTHIPYRDSKLTRILQTSLSGNARISVICTISPSSDQVDETINTLKFASRVKKVVTQAETNEIVDDRALLQKYRIEIQELRSKLDNVNLEFEQKRKFELTQLQQERQKIEEEMLEQQLLRTAFKERIDHLTKLILTSSNLSHKSLQHSQLPVPVTTPIPIQGSTLPDLEYENIKTPRIEELEKEIESKNKVIEKLTNEVESLSFQLKEKTVELEAAQDVKKSQIEENNILKRQVKDLEEKLQNLTDLVNFNPEQITSQNDTAVGESPRSDLSPTLTIAVIEGYDKKLAEKEDEIKILKLHLKQYDQLAKEQLHALEKMDANNSITFKEPSTLVSTPEVTDQVNDLKFLLNNERSLRQTVESHYSDTIVRFQGDVQIERAMNEAKEMTKELSEYDDDETF